MSNSVGNSPARTLKRVIGKSHLDDWRGLDSDNTPVAHGIRHTFKTWASAHDYPDELSEAQSARSKRGVGARYNHDTSISDHRKEMMTKWDNFLRGVKSNG
jgi:integrase